MRSKSAYLLTLTVAVLIFGIATDKASSHKLSSLAVRAFDSAVGTAIELVKPSLSAGKTASQRSTKAGSPAAFPARSHLQSTALAEAQTAETTGHVAAEVADATEPEVQSKDEEAAEQQAGSFPSRFTGSRSSFNGGALGAPRSAERATAEQAVSPVDVTAGAATAPSGSELMEVAISQLDRDYGAHTVGSALDFTTPAKSSPRSGSPNSSNPSGAQPGSPETTQPGGSNPITVPSPIPGPVFDETAPFSPAPGGELNPVPAVPALPQPAASSPSPAVVPASNNPSDALDLPVPPFDDIVDLGGNGFPPAPGGPPTEIDDLLILPPNIAPPGLVAPTPASEDQFALDTQTIVNPEPASLVLFGSGLAFVAQCVRRRRARGL